MLRTASSLALCGILLLLQTSPCEMQTRRQAVCSPEGKSASVWSETTVALGFGLRYTYRVIKSNGCPSHRSGVLAGIPEEEEQHALYDINVNGTAIETTYLLPNDPIISENPMNIVNLTGVPYGAIGLALSGAIFFGPRHSYDTGVDTVLAMGGTIDACGGHPDTVTGVYHYHTTPKCVLDGQLGKEYQHSALVGYAFDGFAIYGPYGTNGTLPTDLDECGGHDTDEGGIDVLPIWTGNFNFTGNATGNATSNVTTTIPGSRYHYHMRPVADPEPTFPVSDTSQYDEDGDGFGDGYPYTPKCFKGCVPNMFNPPVRYELCIANCDNAKNCDNLLTLVCTPTTTDAAVTAAAATGFYGLPTDIPPDLLAGALQPGAALSSGSTEIVASSLGSKGINIDGVELVCSSASDINQRANYQPPYPYTWEHRGNGTTNNGKNVDLKNSTAPETRFGAAAVAARQAGQYGGLTSEDRGVQGGEPPPSLNRIEPNSGPFEGGTTITVHGQGFRRRALLTCRFAATNDLHDVRAVYVGPHEIRCVTPPRRAPDPAQVTVSNDGVTFSAAPIQTAQGSGTFAVFHFTSIIPEGRLLLDNVTGPFMGGTLVTVTILDYEVVTITEQEPVMRQVIGEHPSKITGPIPPPAAPAAPPGGEQSGELAEALLAALEFYGFYGYYPEGFDPLASRAPPMPASPPPPYTYPPPPSPPPCPPPPSPPPASYYSNQSGTYLFYGMDFTQLTALVEEGKTKYGPQMPANPCEFKPCHLVTTFVTTERTETRPVLAARFEPSNLLSCKFRYEGVPLTNNTPEGAMFQQMVGTVTESELEHVVPATWLSYNQIRCFSPAQLGNRDDFDSNLTLRVRVSNNREHYSDAFAPFLYTSIAPEVLDIYTDHKVGAYKARGPHSGNTEVLFNGLNFLPSEYLVAKFTKVTNTSEYQIAPCDFDTPNKIRCITSQWLGTPRSETSGGLNPAFLTMVDISNSNGSRWSFPNSERFLFSDIWISTYGSDIYGAGTPAHPYRTLYKAVNVALQNPRAYYIEKSNNYASTVFGWEIVEHAELKELTGQLHRGQRGRTIGRYVNHDRIIMMAGSYSNTIGSEGYEQNIFISPIKKMIEIMADFNATPFIDCGGRPYGPVIPYSADDVNWYDAEMHGVFTHKNIQFSRCEDSTEWHEYDSHRKQRPFQYTPYVAPVEYVSVCEPDVTSRFSEAFYGAEPGLLQDSSCRVVTTQEAALLQAKAQLPTVPDMPAFSLSDIATDDEAVFYGVYGAAAELY